MLPLQWRRRRREREVVVPAQVCEVALDVPERVAAPDDPARGVVQDAVFISCRIDFGFDQARRPHHAFAPIAVRVHDPRDRAVLIVEVRPHALVGVRGLRAPDALEVRQADVVQPVLARRVHAPPLGVVGVIVRDSRAGHPCGRAGAGRRRRALPDIRARPSTRPDPRWRRTRTRPPRRAIPHSATR